MRDYAYTLIKNEMDSDFEDKCQAIAKKRRDRKVSISKYLPPYIHTPDEPDIGEAIKQQSDSGKSANQLGAAAASKVSPCRKRKVPSWQRGFLGSRKKRKRDRPVLSETPAEDQVGFGLLRVAFRNGTDQFVGSFNQQDKFSRIHLNESS